MFGTLLHKIIKIEDKNFHTLFDVGAHVDQLEKFGIEIIKLSSDIRREASEQEKANQIKQEDKPCESCIESPPVLDEVKQAE